jgi:lipopolysaccharide biosynthesis protein
MKNGTLQQTNGTDMNGDDFGRRARLIAFYLPQFHPIPENDEWWGPGFTEWTNVAQAKPLFRGHVQPNLPADLGFYDLRVPETRAAQAAIAREAGIEGFCYWHYWFGGRRLLERPFQEVLQSGEPDFPFCLGWANHTWTGIWYGAPNRILVEQTYPGLADFERHFHFLMTAFADSRYIRVEGKPLLLIFKPTEIPDSRRVLDYWQHLAIREGLPGIHFVAHMVDEDEVEKWNPISHGYSAVTIARLRPLCETRRISLARRIRRKCERNVLLAKLFKLSPSPSIIVPYASIVDELLIQKSLSFDYNPCVMPNWDNTPRSGKRGWVVTGSTPELYQRHLEAAIERVSELPSSRRIIFIKSWNEWAEGNYLEPDQRHGHAYLNATRRAVFGTRDRNRDVASRIERVMK